MHLRRLEKAGKLVKVKASYKLGDELKKAPKKAKPAAKKPATKPKAVAKTSAAKPKASKPKKVASATGQHIRSILVMLCSKPGFPGTVRDLLQMCSFKCRCSTPMLGTTA